MTKIADLKKLLEDEWHATRTFDALNETPDEWQINALHRRQNALRGVLDYVLEVLAEVSKPYYDKRRLGARPEDSSADNTKGV